MIDRQALAAVTPRRFARPFLDELRSIGNSRMLDQSPRRYAAAEVEARTIGARLYQPAFAPDWTLPAITVAHLPEPVPEAIGPADMW
ncbi:MAG TPA: hypothetical protein VHT50_25745 [Mycobacterium sp.]|nr:hypothetical protein [Mycobacterium sp.]